MSTISACLASSGDAAASSDDDAASCTTSSTCADTYPRSCLVTAIPAYGISTTARVHCCLRCCVSFWLDKLGLAANARHWEAVGKADASTDISSGTGGNEAASSDGQRSNKRAGDHSLLFHRFSMARYAHVQAVTLEDWSALVTVAADPSEAAHTSSMQRFCTPSASSASAALIVLNGFGHIVSARRAPMLNASSFRASIEGGAIVHSTAPPAGGSRMVFADPIQALIQRALSPRGAHAVLYGDDKSLSSALLTKYQQALGPRLARYFAPNLSPQAARLPFATAVPLGLNRNARGLMRPGGLLDPASGAVGKRQAKAHGRKPSLLCCCQRPYDHRLEIARKLSRAGFNCSGLLAAGGNGDGGGGEPTRTFEETLTLYSKHRFVLAMHGRGNQDFRLWEIMLAGAVPVMEYFEEHDLLLEGLPIVRVSNWSALTPAWLQREWERIQHGVKAGTLSWTKLYLPYWLHKFTAHMPVAEVE